MARTSSAACGGVSVPKSSNTVSWGISPYQRVGLEFIILKSAICFRLPALINDYYF